MDDSDSQKQLAIVIAGSASRAEADALRDWARLLIDLKDEKFRPQPRHEKRFR
ncbi:hypothetical protein [Rhizobium leguminosarum]|uniref:hypothetical protein n=1 Tax=Rhizobium leguminosarum TaxID=384 RepID=UPI001C95A74D|nr:hypothetical protein [Rhizobium leguminosarum]MBY5658499.1 hypothetical protein [Rhizobium leguminosarum]